MLSSPPHAPLDPCNQNPQGSVPSRNHDERSGLYEKFADHIIDVDEQSIEATAQELAKIARNGQTDLKML